MSFHSSSSFALALFMSQPTLRCAGATVRQCAGRHILRYPIAWCAAFISLRNTPLVTSSLKEVGVGAPPKTLIGSRRL
ncbi:hypothetical protein FB567DRAFT_325117 [Paraphoma chrysanthemicola]|uniref:Secreted protein n=1 Tax=Paraphoma chrysanthemicola TaxID=798071 RepID=A0A8K0R9N6_9PLEO|nr:hypothetical protein FB567DRAFT_325117 [Paraphoma chrysanthemicola]